MPETGQQTSVRDQMAAKEAVEENMAIICQFAERIFAGTAARFALVLWPEGFEAEPGAVAIASHPDGRASAPAALRTAAEALSPRKGGSDE